MAEDEKVRIKDVVSHTTTKIKWMTIWWLIYSFKNIWKTLNDWIDNYQKNRIKNVWIGLLVSEFMIRFENGFDGLLLL
jgi:hypothetical protein